MTRTPRTVLAALVLLPSLALAACGGDSSDGTTGGTTSPASGTEDTGTTESPVSPESPESPESMEGTDMHDHAMDGGDAPGGIADATDPAYPVGTEVTVNADHMAGMQGAKGDVTGAFATTAYAVSYTPTDGGDPVTGHRWVVQEELEPREDTGSAPLPDGTEITLNADHMPGMQGATATVDYSTQETVYMVDITTADGMTMKNHKWVTESELAPAE